MQLDQQALNAVPGDERKRLYYERVDTSSTAQDVRAHSLPGKALPSIYLIVGILSLRSIHDVVQEMLRSHEYGGVVIDKSRSPADIRSDYLTAQADSVVVIRANGLKEPPVPSTSVTVEFLRHALYDQ